MAGAPFSWPVPDCRGPRCNGAEPTAREAGVDRGSTVTGGTGAAGDTGATGAEPVGGPPQGSRTLGPCAPSSGSGSR